MSDRPVPFSAGELGAMLVELSVVSQQQWEFALSRAGDGDNLGAALDILSRSPAHWATGAVETSGIVRSTALTPFQLAQIEKCRAAGTLPKLKKLLRWNGHLLLETIGKGGMGVVYKGWDLEHNRYVAIKRTHREGAEARKRMRREASIQRRINHPNIARLYGRERLGSADLLVLEYLPGLTLAELVAKRAAEQKPLPWAFVAELAVDLCDALDHAHGNNPLGVTVIHRDIKPGNVMLMRRRVGLGEKYVPKLLDLGLAKWVGDKKSKGGQIASESVGEELTRAFQILGTPEYMPPEQWEGGAAAVVESDVYSLGGTLYYALAGETPFRAKSKGNKMTFMAELCELHRVAERPSIRAKRPDVPVEVDRLLRQMMAGPPSHRGKPSDLRDQFKALLANPPRPPAAVSSSGKVPVPGPRTSSTVPALVTPADARTNPNASGRMPKPTSGPASGVKPPPSPRESASVFDLVPAEAPASPRPSLPIPPPSGRSNPPANRNRESMGGGGRSMKAVTASAQNLFDGSNTGKRERAALTGRIAEQFRQIVRPDQNPIPLVATVVILGLIAALIATELAIFLGVLILFAVGFAYAMNKPD